jgi:hypothetical protein
MATTTPDLSPANPARLRLLTFPREHGAWGILLVPLITGAAIGYHTPSSLIALLLLALAALALFCLRTPLESWMAASSMRPQTTAERRAVLVSMATSASLAAAALTLVIWLQRAWDLLLLGAAVGALFLVQAALKKLGRETRMRAQLAGSLGLTATAAAAYYVAAGKLDATAFVLWGVNWLFAANQIHFVQLRIHAARITSRAEKLARGRAFLSGELLALILLGVVWRLGYLPGLAILAFAPILLRGAIWPLSARTESLQVRRLGLSELAHAIAFGVLVILCYRLSGI